MKRLLVLSAVLLPLSLFIAGCGGSGGSSGKKTEMTPEQMEQQKAKVKAEMQQSMTKRPMMESKMMGK
jgi:hypothetical protein